MQVDRGYRNCIPYLREKFPKAEIFIPPMVTNNDVVSQNQSARRKTRKPILTQEDADYQRLSTMIRWSGEKGNGGLKWWERLAQVSKLTSVFNGLHFTISRGIF